MANQLINLMVYISIQDEFLSYATELQLGILKAHIDTATLRWSPVFVFFLFYQNFKTVWNSNFTTFVRLYTIVSAT